MTFFNIFSNRKIKEKEKTIIIVDNREKNSLVISELIKRNTIKDFKSSIIDKRIFSQLNELKQYPNHLLILEGLENTELYKGQIHENAFRGFLLSVALNFKTPIIYSINEEDTAKYLSILATKKNKKTEPIRASKTLSSDKEQLQFILEGFPEIGPATTN